MDDISKEFGSFERPDEKKRTTKQKVIAGLALAGLVVGGTAGGYIGWEDGQGLERSANADSLKKAQAYERCIGLVEKNSQPGSNTAVVRLATLSKQEQTDCGVEQYMSAANNYARGGNDFYTSLPLDAKVLKTEFNPVVQLPSPDRLRQAVISETRDANDFSNGNALSTATLGAMFGFMGSVAILIGAAGVAQRLERRREQDSLAVQIITPYTKPNR